MSEIKTQNYIAELAARGVYHFTAASLAKERGSSLNSARLALNRLASQGIIAMPYRGFFISVPPEYRAIGCLPADQFLPQLMEYLGESYYVGLLSAARYFGAAHHAAQVFQVVTQKNRKSLQCGQVLIEFVAKNHLQQTPAMSVNTPRSVLRVSTLESTALDLVGYQQHCGGLDYVATILHELVEKIRPQKLVEAAEVVPLPWVQRAGYLLNLVGGEVKTKGLQKLVATKCPAMTPLQPGVSMQGSVKDRIFRVAVNTEVEPDL